MAIKLRYRQKIAPPSSYQRHFEAQALADSSIALSAVSRMGHTHGLAFMFTSVSCRSAMAMKESVMKLGIPAGSCLLGSWWRHSSVIVYWIEGKSKPVAFKYFFLLATPQNRHNGAHCTARDVLHINPNKQQEVEPQIFLQSRFRLSAWISWAAHGTWIPWGSRGQNDQNKQKIF